MVHCESCGLLYRRSPSDADESAYWAQYAASAREQAYDALREPFHDIWWKRVRSLPRTRPAADRRPRVLDVGCVPGSLLERAIRDGWEAHGVETSAALCDLTVRRCAAATVWQGFLESIDFGDVRFDLVVLGDCLRHASRPLDLLVKAHDLLLPGGALVIREIDARHTRHRERLRKPNPCDMQFFADTSLMLMLVRAGFTEISASNAPMSLMTNRRARSLAKRAPRAHRLALAAANRAFNAMAPIERLCGRRITPSFMMVAHRSQVVCRQPNEMKDLAL